MWWDLGLGTVCLWVKWMLWKYVLNFFCFLSALGQRPKNSFEELCIKPEKCSNIWIVFVFRDSEPQSARSFANGQETVFTLYSRVQNSNFIEKVKHKWWGICRIWDPLLSCRVGLWRGRWASHLRFCLPQLHTALLGSGNQKLKTQRSGNYYLNFISMFWFEIVENSAYRCLMMISTTGRSRGTRRIEAIVWYLFVFFVVITATWRRISRSIEGEAGRW